MKPEPPPHQLIKRGLHPVLAGALCLALSLCFLAVVLVNIWGRG